MVTSAWIQSNLTSTSPVFFTRIKTNIVYIYVYVCVYLDV